MTPNPTEAQTSEYRFQQFLAEMRRDDTVKWPPSVAFPYMNKAFNAAWDSRQPEIDRLRAALEEAWYGLSQWEAYGRTHHPPSVPTARKWTQAAREALDG